MYKNKIKN